MVNSGVPKSEEQKFQTINNRQGSLYRPDGPDRQNPLRVIPHTEACQLARSGEGESQVPHQMSSCNAQELEPSSRGSHVSLRTITLQRRQNGPTFGAKKLQRCHRSSPKARCDRMCTAPRSNGPIDLFHIDVISYDQKKDKNRFFVFRNLHSHS